MNKKETFSEYLLHRKLITKEQYESALEIQNKGRRFEEIALELGYITKLQSEEILRKQQEESITFHEAALSLGYATSNQVKYIYDIRLRRKIRIGKILVEQGFIDEKQLYESLMEYESNRQRLEKILICTTTKVVAKGLQKYLEKYRYTLLVATDYEQAKKIAREQRPDLLITNLTLWGTHRGDVLCSELIANPETANIQTIVISSDDNIRKVEDLFEYGVHYLLKVPFSETELLNIIYSIEEHKSDQQKEKILVVDDSPIIRSMIAKELKNKYHLVMGTNGREGVLIAEEKQPDIILMDVEMPEMDGYTACSIIRSNHRTSHIPVIIISSLQTEQDHKKGFEAGASEYFTKPFPPGQLKNTIDNLLEARKVHRQESILIVDDSSTTHHILHHLLTKNGFTPETAERGNDALKRIQEKEFDLILCDLKMPGLGGAELCSILKKDDRYRHIPFIIISSHDEKSSVMESLSAGANDFLTKPFDEDELLARINVHIDSKHLYDNLLDALEKNKLSEQELLKQRNLLKGINKANTLAMSKGNLMNFLEEAIKELALAAEADRGYIYEQVHHKEETHMALRFEWTRETILPRRESTEFLNINVNKVPFLQWYKRLASGHSITGTTETFSPEEQEFIKPLEILSTLILPIFVDDALWGMLGFDNCFQQRLWSNNEESIMLTATLGIGGAIEKEIAAEQMAKYYQEIQTANKELNLLTQKLEEDVRLNTRLRDITQLFLSVQEKEYFNETVQSSLGMLFEFFPMERFYLFEVSMAGIRVTHSICMPGKEGDIDQYDNLDIDKFINSFPLFLCDTFIVPDVKKLGSEYEYITARYEKAEIRSLIHIASLAHGETVKCIGADSKDPFKEITEQEVDFLRKVVTLINSTEEKVRLFEEIVEKNRHLQELSIKDGLTGLYNHRHFQDVLDIEVQRACRYLHTNLCLILLDIDFFKKFNDNYGHQVGDDVLRIVASIMLESVRTSDLAARYGGEEFVIILPETELRGAEIFAERLRIAIEEYDFLVNGDKVHITASLGLSIFLPGMTKELLIETADMALLAAKQEGRNRVKIFKE